MFRQIRAMAAFASLIALLLLGMPQPSRAQCDTNGGCAHGIPGMMRQSMTAHGMMHQRMMGQADKGTAQSPGESGAQDFKHVCTKCHALPSPKLHTAAQWPRVVKRMRQHLTAAGITLDRRTELEIEHYLEKRAKN